MDDSSEPGTTLECRGQQRRRAFDLIAEEVRIAGPYADGGDAGLAQSKVVFACKAPARMDDMTQQAWHCGQGADDARSR